MDNKVFTTSEEEKNRLIKDGYVLVSEAYFVENGIPHYTLEKGTEWAKKHKDN